jgi:hypothetical protein
MNGNSMKSYFLLFFFFLSVFLFTAGGRVASSDENAFFLEARSLVEHGTLAIPEGIVNNGAYGPDGRFYVGAGIGFGIVAAPFLLLGEGILKIVPVEESYRILILKGFFSLTNQFLCAGLGALFFLFCRQCNYSKKLSFFLTGAFLFSTNLFPYAKSAMREPLITLCLLAAVYYLWQFRMFRQTRSLHRAGFTIAFLLITKWSFVILLPCVGLYFMMIFDDRLFSKAADFWRDIKKILTNMDFWKQASFLSVWILGAFIITGVYNYSQFGNVFSSGYTERPQPFTNPFWVGIYGLLFSSGKSFFLYAPMTFLIFWSGRRFYLEHVKETLFFLSIFLVMLVFHAKYFAWAGDGSWGPRYLIPTIPLFLIAVGAAFQKTVEETKKIYKLVAVTLAIAGFVIQLGGVSIYLGSYLRYIGEFPFTRSFSDPEFMYQSHFVPNYSPVVGHWELLFKAIEKHARGEIGELRIADTQQRIPLAESDRSKVVYLIDYWFMYAYYAGVKSVWILMAVGVLGIGAGFLGWKNYRNFLQKENEI